MGFFFNIYSMSGIRKDVDKIYNKIAKLALGGRDREPDYKKLIDNSLENGEYDHFLLALEKYYKIEAFEYKTVSEIKQLWPSILEKTKSPLINRLTSLYKKKNVYQIGYEIRSESVDFINISLSETLSSTYSTVSDINPLISFSKNENHISINILSTSVYNININKTSWDEQIPTDINLFESISNEISATASYVTNIPLEKGTYMIKVDTNDSYYSYRYRLNIVNTDLLGTIKEVDSIDLSTNYLFRNKKMSEILGQKKTYLEVQRIDESEPITIIFDNQKLSEEMNLYKRYEMAIDYLLN